MLIDPDDPALGRNRVHDPDAVLVEQRVEFLAEGAEACRLHFDQLAVGADEVDHEPSDRHLEAVARLRQRRLHRGVQRALTHHPDARHVAEARCRCGGSRVGADVMGRIASLMLGRPATRAVPACGPLARIRTLCTGCGVLESVIVDREGRLLFTSQTWEGRSRGALLRLDAPHARPVAVAVGIPSPGGLALSDDGRLIVGFGDSPAGGLVGNFSPRAGLLLVDPAGGGAEPWVSGLGMANGVARAPDGTVFASNDFGTHLDRVAGGRTVQRRWARVPSANGLVVDPAGRYLYAAQTFTRAAIRRVEIARPENVTTHARPPGGRRALMPRRPGDR